MRPGPKAIIGLGAPAALRAITPSKGGGVPANAFRDDLNDNSLFFDDQGAGSLLVDDLAA